MKLILLFLLLLSSCVCLPKQTTLLPSASQVIVFEDSVTELSADKFEKDLLAADSGNSAVFVVIRTGGGSVKAGLKMVNAIQFAKNPVVCIVDQEAMSMGSYIFEACPRRIMIKGGMLMMHKPSLGSPLADLVEFRFLDGLLSSMCEAMAVNMNITGPELRALILLKHEVYWTWREAMHYGAIDQVESSLKEALEHPFRDHL